MSKLIVFHNTMKNKGGAQNAIYQICLGFHEMNYEVTLVTNKFNKFDFPLPSDINVYQLYKLSTDSPFYWLVIPKMIAKFKKICYTINPDLIILSSFPSFLSNLKIDNFPIYSYVHEPFPYFYFNEYLTEFNFIKKTFVKILSLIYKTYDLKSIQKAELIITNSQYTKTLIKNIYNRDSIIIPPPSSIVSNNSSNFENEKNTDLVNLLILSPSSPIKGLELIPDLIYELTNRNKLRFHLTIAGKVSKFYDSIITQLQNHYPQKITIEDFVSDEKLVKLYRKSDYLLYLSTREPFGITPIEALHFGCIPIVLNQGGPATTIINNNTGFVVPLDNYLNKIIEIIENKLLIKNLGSKYSNTLHRSNFVNKFISIMDTHS